MLPKRLAGADAEEEWEAPDASRTIGKGKGKGVKGKDAWAVHELVGFCGLAGGRAVH